MRKLFIILVAALSIGVAHAQTTIPKATEVEIYDVPGMLTAFSPIGYRIWSNQVGGLTLFTAFNGSLDSVKSQAWEVTVKAARANDPGAKYIVDVKGVLLRNPMQEVTYIDTIDARTLSNKYLPIPKAGKLGALFAHDSTFALYFNIANTAKIGDKTVIKFDRHVPLFADSLGKLITIPE